jgi:purine-binding chemotaxis protein CheW
MGSLTRFATFHVDGLLFGVEFERVQEVIRAHDVTPVPLAPSVIGGLINIRGQIVTVIELRRRLELPERPEGQAPMNVVLPHQGGVVSLLVDGVAEVVEADEDQFEAPPETLRGTPRQLIRGAYKLDHRLLLVLDVDRVLAIGEEDRP